MQTSNQKCAFSCSGSPLQREMGKSHVWTARWACFAHQQYTLNVFCLISLLSFPFILPLALSQLEAELIAPFAVIPGNSATLECSVSKIPYLIVPLQLQLIGPEGMVLESEESFSISITLDSVATSQAGDQYCCEAQLEIEAVGISMSSRSDNYAVRVEGKSVTLI